MLPVWLDSYWYNLLKGFKSPSMLHYSSGLALAFTDRPPQIYIGFWIPKHNIGLVYY